MESIQARRIIQLGDAVGGQRGKQVDLRPAIFTLC